ARIPERPPRRPQRSVKAAGNGFARASRTTGDAHHDPHSLARSERQLEERSCIVETYRRRLEGEGCDALHAVEAEIAQPNRCIRPSFGRQLAATSPLAAADLEQIGKIGAKIDAEGQLVWLHVEIADQDALIACVIPNELQAIDMNELAAQLA